MERGRVFVSKRTCLGNPSRKEQVVCFLGAWRSHKLKEKYAFGGVFWKTGEPLRIVLFLKNLSSHWSQLCLHFAVDIADLCGYFQETDP